MRDKEEKWTKGRKDICGWYEGPHDEYHYSSAPCIAQPGQTGVGNNRAKLTEIELSHCTLHRSIRTSLKDGERGKDPVSWLSMRATYAIAATSNAC